MNHKEFKRYGGYYYLGIVLVLLLALFLPSCKTTKTSIESRQTNEVQRTDSVGLLIEREIKAMIVPQATVIFDISPGQLDSLPAGAFFQQKSGNASGTVTKNNDNTLTFTANCDSLVLLVESLKKEVYHFQSENTTLKNELNERQTQVIKEPSGWQWVQIYAGRILSGFLFLYIIYMVIKRRLKK